MKTIFMNKKLYSVPKKFLMAQTCLIFSFFFPATAFAYVDPGSGSVIVTTILGLVAALGYTFRKYFYKIKRIITGKKIKKDEQQDES